MDHASAAQPDGACFFRQLGIALQVMRHRRGLSIEQCGKRSGVGKSQMSKYETGKELPKLGTLARILDALEVEPIWFFYLMYQLSREKALDSLHFDLLVPGGRGAWISEDLTNGFQALFRSILEVHSLMAAKRAMPAGERKSRGAREDRVARQIG